MNNIVHGLIFTYQEPETIICAVESKWPLDTLGIFSPEVTLRNHSPDFKKNIRLPSMRYLALHAACARVAHLSGAGEYIAKIVRDEEDRTARTPVLAHDGTDSDLLASRISTLTSVH